MRTSALVITPPPVRISMAAPSPSLQMSFMDDHNLFFVKAAVFAFCLKCHGLKEMSFL